MSDMADTYYEMRQEDGAFRQANLEAADPTGWTQHTSHHWHREYNGFKLDYWPSTGTYRYKGKVYKNREVTKFIDGTYLTNWKTRQAVNKRNREQEDDG